MFDQKCFPMLMVKFNIKDIQVSYRKSVHTRGAQRLEKMILFCAMLHLFHNSLNQIVILCHILNYKYFFQPSASEGEALSTECQLAGL